VSHVLVSQNPGVGLSLLPNNETGTLPVLVATEGGFRFGEVTTRRSDR